MPNRSIISSYLLPGNLTLPSPANPHPTVVVDNPSMPAFQYIPLTSFSLTALRKQGIDEEDLMGPTLLSVFIYLLVSSANHLLCMADDRLTAGKSLFQNQTITSAGGAFVLGFFSPGNSTSANRYVGIWYNIAQQTVVWVANREKPLAGSAGVLRIAEDGNIALLDAEGSTFWSSSVSSNLRNTSAVLMDTGNLILRDGEGNDVWQSFDHPTDTYLPTMEIDFDFRTGLGQSLVAWKDAEDPSPGRYTLGVDPKSPLQLAIKDGSRILWRSLPWDGRQVTGSMDLNSSSLLVQSITLRGQMITLTYATTRLLAMSRVVLDSDGQLNFLSWNSQVMNWTHIVSRPSLPCEFYERCGPFGICDSGGSPLCRCLKGFEPKDKAEWDGGNFTGGCGRRQPLKCDRTDVFVPSSAVKLPDNFLIEWNATAMQCEAKCRADCQCTAYAHANVSVGTVLRSRCLTWVGELIDVARYGDAREDLYLRHVSSELDADSNASSSSKKKILPRVIVPSVIIGVLLTGSLYYFLWRRQKGQVRTRKDRRGVLYDEERFSEMLGGEKDVSEVPLLDFSIVAAATNNFASANKLGRGGFGPVYKGTLFRGHEIAVKRLSESSGQGFDEFENEVELIAKLQHTNLVRLLGWCSHEDEKILIYEYMPNGSLDRFIFDQRRSAELDWRKRFKIIEGIANGLLYLHRYSRLRIIHRDLKASNILLDASMNPKISDFGLARIFGGNQTEANTEKIIGTYGYMSPEYALDGLFSEKSDVFSFGVLLLEIITGKRSTGFYPYKESLNLLGFVWHMWDEDRGSELLDPSAEGILGAPEVMKCIQVGLLCVQDNAAERPAMSSVVLMLGKENASLPVPKQPAFATKTPNPLSDIELLTASEEHAKEITTTSGQTDV